MTLRGNSSSGVDEERRRMELITILEKTVSPGTTGDRGEPTGGWRVRGTEEGGAGDLGPGLLVLRGPAGAALLRPLEPLRSRRLVFRERLQPRPPGDTGLVHGPRRGPWAPQSSAGLCPGPGPWSSRR